MHYNLSAYHQQQNWQNLFINKLIGGSDCEIDLLQVKRTCRHIDSIQHRSCHI